MPFAAATYAEMLAKWLGTHFALLDESQYATFGVAVLLSVYLNVGHVSRYAKGTKTT